MKSKSLSAEVVLKKVRKASRKASSLSGGSSAKKKRDGQATGGCPMHFVGESELTYNDYLMIPSLLSLQRPLSQPAHHDEYLFIVIHQAYELWFKLILHEMQSAMNWMNQDNVLEAHHFISRVVQILKLLVNQIHILETMRPVDFLQFRDHLRPASGFQSAQFREVEFLAGLKDKKYLEYFQNRPDLLKILQARMDGPDLCSSFIELLDRRGYSIPKKLKGRKPLKEGVAPPLQSALVRAILPIYQKPSEHPEIYLLSESLVEFDQHLGLWREHHVRVVERIIGAKMGTGGSEGVGYLRSTTSKKCFPMLWEVRSHLETGDPESAQIGAGSY